MLRRLIIHQAGVKPLLLWGADRDLALTVGGAAFGLFWLVQSVPAFLLALFLATAGFYALRQLAKYDPDIKKVYNAHRRYRDYYPPRSAP